MSWWEDLSDYLDALERTSGEAPDPWADIELGGSSLTEAQVAFLAFDQPPMPRLGGLGDEPDPSIDTEPGGGTGKTPGDG